MSLLLFTSLSRFVMRTSLITNKSKVKIIRCTKVSYGVVELFYTMKRQRIVEDNIVELIA